MLGGYEWIIVLIAIALLLFGAKKIPEFVRNLGMAVSEFKRGRMIVDKEIEEEARAPRTKPAKKVKRAKMATDPTDHRIKLVKRARALDIKTKGKSNKELEEEIAESLE